MRISAWSSDVCSSDLPAIPSRVVIRAAAAPSSSPAGPDSPKPPNPPNPPNPPKPPNPPETASGPAAPIAGSSVVICPSGHPERCTNSRSDPDRRSTRNPDLPQGGGERLPHRVIRACRACQPAADGQGGQIGGAHV